MFSLSSVWQQLTAEILPILRPLQRRPTAYGSTERANAANTVLDAVNVHREYQVLWHLFSMFASLDAT